MRRLALALALSSLVGPVAAQWTICSIKSQKDSVAFRAVGWNAGTGEAKAMDGLGATHQGRVTGSRPHGSGRKVNLAIDFNDGIFGRLPTEFVVFPSGSEVRVIGVSYRIVDGARLLDISWGNHIAECSTL